MWLWRLIALLLLVQTCCADPELSDVYIRTRRNTEAYVSVADDSCIQVHRAFPFITWAMSDAPAFCKQPTGIRWDGTFNTIELENIEIATSELRRVAPLWRSANLCYAFISGGSNNVSMHFTMP